MSNLISIPVASVTALTAERAVEIMRALLRSECAYAKLSPSALTISSRLTTADGGIDAKIDASSESDVPSDCIFRPGLAGFQIKSGTAFKPWTKSSIRAELLNDRGDLCPEVERLVRRGGAYTLICTGHDLTPEQRNDSRDEIALVLMEMGFDKHGDLVDVIGASQLAEFAERYPGVASLLAIDPIQEAWVFEEWRHDAHMANAFEESPEQSRLIAQIRAGLMGETKHIRVLGDPGLGKTRIVLEAVKDENIAPYVLYIQNGALFGQTRLFRQLLRSGYDKPLVLVLDDLSESELSDIWRHLKPRCGSLKIVSLDHGRDETHDIDIERVHAPRLPDETIKKILESRVGESSELDRWVAICEGSPRVAQAVADNLYANPDDLLKPPATVPIWTRFLHGYSGRNDSSARQVNCVSQHLALFNRFGYEAPVGDEALYIFALVQKVDPTIGWARFQEIIQNLRARRVLQGSKTLFFVPKALHIYLWKKYWENYGRGFDFIQIFAAMPVSLHIWFMSMFKYAEGEATSHIIGDILKTDGVFSQRASLTSEKGARFLSILAEADPAAVLRLLESTVGKWTDQQLLEFKDNRQNIVWALEKIAVWSPLTVRAIHVLSRFAVNENADYSNNATGTLTGLFRIGPEEAATESTPDARLPAMLRLLRASGDAERLLGLKAMDAALDSRGMGFRIVGPEYQGLKQRAKLWIPTTYGEWWQAKHIYFQALVNETRNWPSSLCAEVCQALLEAVEQQIRTPHCTDLAFQVLNILVEDSAMSPERLNHFFWHWREYMDDGEHSEITRRLRSIEKRYTQRDLVSRFRRYVIDIDWMEWDDDFREQRDKPRNRSKNLVNALARRIARHPELFGQIQHLIFPEKNAPALWHFGQQLALNDPERAVLPALIRVALETKHQVCLHGYLSEVRIGDLLFYTATVSAFLSTERSSWLGVSITLRSDYDDELFVQCLDALDKRWVKPVQFQMLRFGKAINAVRLDRTSRLLDQLMGDDSQEARTLLIELLDLMPFDGSSPFNADFVFRAVSQSIPGEDHGDVMRGYHWKNVCQKLIKWNESQALPLLESLLDRMNKAYSLSYDSNVSPIANELVQTDPVGAWNIVKTHLEKALPKWRMDLLNWLKGGLSGFHDEQPKGSVVYFPLASVIEWIEEDPEPRSVLMAHAVPGTLDDEQGGRLTRELLSRYGLFKGVQNGISATFHSGGWSGPTSAYLKKKREKLRRWLAAGCGDLVARWIEQEIEDLDRRIVHEEIDEERSRFD